MQKHVRLPLLLPKSEHLEIRIAAQHRNDVREVLDAISEQFWDKSNHVQTKFQHLFCIAKVRILNYQLVVSSKRMSEQRVRDQIIGDLKRRV